MRTHRTVFDLVKRTVTSTELLAVWISLLYDFLRLHDYLRLQYLRNVRVIGTACIIFAKACVVRITSVIRIVRLIQVVINPLGPMEILR